MPKRVLVVDDHPAVALALKVFLRSDGRYEVSDTAKTAAEGLQLLDDTVAIAGLKTVRDAQGRIRLQRAYDFEYSDTGDNRRKGSLVLQGRRVVLFNVGSREAQHPDTLH